LFKERRCRSCREIKDLMSDFYVIRKGKKYLPSSYSYECKDCTIKRIMNHREGKSEAKWDYPDW